MGAASLTLMDLMIDDYLLNENYGCQILQPASFDDLT